MSCENDDLFMYTWLNKNKIKTDKTMDPMILDFFNHSDLDTFKPLLNAIL